MNQGGFRNKLAAALAFGLSRPARAAAPKLPRALRRLLEPYTGAARRGDGQDGAYLEAAEQKRARRQARRAADAHGIYLEYPRSAA